MFWWSWWLCRIDLMVAVVDLPVWVILSDFVPRGLAELFWLVLFLFRCGILLRRVCFCSVPLRISPATRREWVLRLWLVDGGGGAIASQSCFLFGLLVSVQGWQFDCWCEHLLFLVQFYLPIPCFCFQASLTNWNGEPEGKRGDAHLLNSSA